MLNRGTTEINRNNTKHKYLGPGTQPRPPWPDTDSFIARGSSAGMVTLLMQYRADFTPLHFASHKEDLGMQSSPPGSCILACALPCCLPLMA